MSHVIEKHGIAWFDGGNRGAPGPHACAVVLKIDGEMPYKKERYLGPSGTNNQAEIQGFIMALRLAAENGVTHLKLRSDSKLIVEQALGNWKIKDETLRRLHADARRLAQEFFEQVEIDHVRREYNQEADAIVTRLLDKIVGKARSK